MKEKSYPLLSEINIGLPTEVSFNQSAKFDITTTGSSNSSCSCLENPLIAKASGNQSFDTGFDLQ